MEGNAMDWGHRLLRAVAATLLAVSIFALEVGKDYDTLPNPVPTESSGRIEVIEFFWYGCIHCNNLQPRVDVWRKTLPADVVFRQEHAMWPDRSDMAGHARLFVTLKLMGQAERLNAAVFDAIHREKIELRDRKVLLDWVARQGLDAKAFEAVYDSFAARTQFTRAMQLTRDYRLTATPVFAVNGRYITSPGKLNSETRVFEVLDALIAQVRQAATAAARP
jgi:thiol:disulfide interchange protein DsbA